MARPSSCRRSPLLVPTLLAGVSAAAAAAPVIDTRSTSPVTVVTSEQLEKLPTGRRLEDLIRSCPSDTLPTIARQPDVLIDGKPVIDLNCVQPADIEMIEVLRTHNDLRAQYGAAPLAWDPALADGAQGYVNILSRTGQLVHAPREGRGTVRENISQGLPNYRASQLLDNWLNERRYFVPGTFPNVSTTGDWYQVGHFSQMLWPTTTTVGCARGVGAGSSWLVCRYNPGGNKDGKPVGQPQLAQREIEPPLPPRTREKAVHETPMAQPYGPPPESILDDLGDAATTPPPESILDDVGQDEPAEQDHVLTDLGVVVFYAQDRSSEVEPGSVFAPRFHQFGPSLQLSDPIIPECPIIGGIPDLYRAGANGAEPFDVGEWEPPLINELLDNPRPKGPQPGSQYDRAWYQDRGGPPSYFFRTFAWAPIRLMLPAPDPCTSYPR